MVESAKSWLLFTSIYCFMSAMLLVLVQIFHVNFYHRFRTDHGWRRMDFASPSRMERHIEMMVAIEKALIQAKCLVQPNVYIMPDVDKGLVG